ncbi:hypothetical protein DFH28DRAFT_1092167 [Melampsora americana]|nr:hypothetical protein DFH28DRAFT_1092167 [Melampsora americana]
MGIQGLLPFLKSIQRSSHIKEWAGKTLAIDAYVWLHRAAYGCAQELCLGTRTTKHIDYVMARVDLLRHHGVIPYVVFDGDALPGKRGTEEQREKRRQTNLALANSLLSEGKKEEAREAFVKATDITPQIAHDVILSLKKAGIKYVVAPYEADAQLRFLELNGHIDGILTEDSDLLVYGAKNVLFKLDPLGHCIHISRDDFGKVKNTQLSLWTDTEFRQMAILSGCDYLPSIHGLGLKKAYQLIKTYKSAERAIKATRLEGNLKVPLGYETLFRRAELTFLYQIVYDPTTRKLVHLHPLPSSQPSSEDLVSCGEFWEDPVAIAVAEGRADPFTKITFQSSINVLPHNSTSRYNEKSRLSQRSHFPSKPTAVPSNQRTLKSFAFTASPEVNSKARSTSAKRSAGQGALHSIENSILQTTSPQASKPSSSKFFEAESTDQAENIPTVSLVPLETSDSTLTCDELVPEDAEPLSQEDWSEISETGGSDELGPDFPSSQMHEEDLKSYAKLLQASQTESIPEITPPRSPVILLHRQNDSLNYSDGVISSPIHDDSRGSETMIQPRITILTEPSLAMNETSSSSLFKSTSKATLPISSDPIIDDDEDDIMCGEPNRPVSKFSSTKRPQQSYDTPTTLKKQRTRPVVVREPLQKGNVVEEMSPALARIASGMRERFTFRGHSSPMNRTPRNLSSTFRKSSITPRTPHMESIDKDDGDRDETPKSAPMIQRRHTDGLSRHSKGFNRNENEHQERSLVDQTSSPKLAAFLFKGGAVSRKG